MATFLTPNRHGYSVRFSPFNPERLVVATSQYFGLAGGGTLFLLEITPEGMMLNLLCDNIFKMDYNCRNDNRDTKFSMV